MKHVALLIIDVQQAFVGHQQHTTLYENTMAYINATSKMFRQFKHPVYVIRDLEEGEGEDYQVVNDLVVNDIDIKMDKYYNNSFWKTSLEEDLKKKGIDTVILCGNALEYCVTATYFGALERGFKALFLQQGIFAVDLKSLDILYATRPLISFTALSTLLNA